MVACPRACGFCTPPLPPAAAACSPPHCGPNCARHTHKPTFLAALAPQRLHTGVTRDEQMYKVKKQALLAGELQPAPPVPLPQQQ